MRVQAYEKRRYPGSADNGDFFPSLLRPLGRLTMAAGKALLYDAPVLSVEVAVLTPLMTEEGRFYACFEALATACRHGWQPARIATVCADRLYPPCLAPHELPATHG